MPKDAEPICVQLCGKHYTALVPPNKTAFLSSWLRETPNVVINLEGGGADKSSAVTYIGTHAHSMSSTDHDEQPGCVDMNDNVSVATPTMYSLNSMKMAVARPILTTPHLP